MFKLLSFACICAALTCAQTELPRFEVASVKPASPGELGGRIQFLPGGIYKVSNVALRFIIQNAYEIREFQIVGEPAMMKAISDGVDARYYIEAKTDASATEAQIREMVKQLLADRFALRVHRETRALPVYALIATKDGPKLREPSSERLGSVAFMTPGWIESSHTTMPSLISALTALTDRPVVDKTGFVKPFSFRLTFLAQPSAETEALSADGCPRIMADFVERRRLKVEPMSCPDIFTAVHEQLGLKLDAQKMPTEVLVVDHAEKPTEN